jgi:cytosine/adenosine deaminase-related metal-dependent hydrolase
LSTGNRDESFPKPQKKESKMTSLLLEGIDTLATFDADRRVLKNAWLWVEGNVIAGMGSGKYEGGPVDRRLDLTGYVVLPGLINLHHHFYQALLKNVPSLQNVSLFAWIRDMSFLMSEVRDEDLYYAAKLNVAELLLSGCTTAVDHNYIKVNDMRHDTGIQAAKEMGIRFHLARGSHDLGQKDGATPLDHTVEKVDDVLADTERLIKTYHEFGPGGMVRIENAPSSLFAVSERLWRESIALARRYGIGNHTHMAEAPDEERWVLERFGMRSVERAEELGWVGPDVWYAHATMLDDRERAIIQRTGTGICNCPNSNMYTAARVCRVAPMLREGGFKIGLGVDGSAANNSSHMLREARNALLMQRAFFGADAMSPTQALEVAILGGAKILRRDDIGVLAPGMAADIVGVDTRRLSFAGGIHDPVAGLILCDVDRVDLSIVNGAIRVERGELLGVDAAELIRCSNERARDLVRRTEAHYGINVSAPVWRRAYPYDEM